MKKILIVIVAVLVVIFGLYEYALREEAQLDLPTYADKSQEPASEDEQQQASPEPQAEAPQIEPAKPSTGPPPPASTAADEAETPITIPEFPWPPPQASASDVVPSALVADDASQNLRLGDIDNRLAAALESCGYTEKSYYAAPDGFALVTRLEQINADGSPKNLPDRWSVALSPLRKFSLRDYLRALFTANAGYFRIIVFVVTPRAFAQSDSGVTRGQAMHWLSGGLNKLPPAIAQRPFTTDYTCTALIYQFEHLKSGEDAALQMPAPLPGRTHLEKTHILSALER